MCCALVYANPAVQTQTVPCQVTSLVWPPLSSHGLPGPSPPSRAACGRETSVRRQMAWVYVCDYVGGITFCAASGRQRWRDILGAGCSLFGGRAERLWLRDPCRPPTLLQGPLALGQKARHAGTCSHQRGTCVPPALGTLTHVPSGSPNLHDCRPVRLWTLAGAPPVAHTHTPPAAPVRPMPAMDRTKNWAERGF